MAKPKLTPRPSDHAQSTSAYTEHRDVDSAAPVDFEQSLAEIERIVVALESGDLGLSESLTQYERAIGRLKDCHRLLAEAEQRVSILAGFDAEGNPRTEPLENAPTSLREKQQARSQRRGAAGKQASQRASDRLDEADGGPATTGVDDSGGLF